MILCDMSTKDHKQIPNNILMIEHDQVSKVDCQNFGQFDCICESQNLSSGYQLRNNFYFARWMSIRHNDCEEHYIYMHNKKEKKGRR